MKFLITLLLIVGSCFLGACNAVDTTHGMAAASSSGAGVAAQPEVVGFWKIDMSDLNVQIETQRQEMLNAAPEGVIRHVGSTEFKQALVNATCRFNADGTFVLQTNDERASGIYSLVSGMHIKGPVVTVTLDGREDPKSPQLIFSVEADTLVFESMDTGEYDLRVVFRRM